jgi:four helix bundle protein
MLLVEEIYRLTTTFLGKEKFGIVDQMCRAAVSIPSNIAEGQYRFKTAQNKQYLRVAYGSCAELDTQLSIAINLHYLNSNEAQVCVGLLDEVMRMLNALLLRKINNN